MRLNWNQLLCKQREGRASYIGTKSIFSSEFERDYYTIVMSSYFRRLKDKTQIFSVDMNDFIRDRLTHSMEVSCIAEMIGKKVAAYIIANGLTDGYGGTDTSAAMTFRDDFLTVLKCAGLLHDLGNPPFGHSGERYIREWMKGTLATLEGKNIPEQMQADLLNFEGNAQNLHIVSKLGKSSDRNDKHGFNLTYAVMGSLIKYPVSSLQKGNPQAMKGKIGYYASEGKLFHNVENALGLSDGKGGFLKNPLMLIMEAADDVAYGVSDLEDSIKTGNMTPEELAAKDEDHSLFHGLEKAKNSHWEANDPDLMISEKVDNVVEYELGKMRESQINKAARIFIENYDEIMNGTFSHPLLEDPEDSSKKEDGISDLFKKIYKKRDEEVENGDLARDKMFRVMDCLWEYANCSSAPETHFDKIQYYFVGSRFKPILSADKNDPFDCDGEREKDGVDLYKKLMAVADYVSGMTDSYVSRFLDDAFSEEYLNRYEKQLHVEIAQSIADIYHIPEEKGFDKTTIILNVLASEEHQGVLNDQELILLIHAISDGVDKAIEEARAKEEAEAKEKAANSEKEATAESQKDEEFKKGKWMQLLKLIAYEREEQKGEPHKFVQWFDSIMERGEKLDICADKVKNIKAAMRKLEKPNQSRKA